MPKPKRAHSIGTIEELETVWLSYTHTLKIVQKTKCLLPYCDSLKDLPGIQQSV